MTTPEGKVKRKVTSFLRSLGDDCYYFMPVQMGYGSSALDYMGAYKGRAFAIETKAFGKKPTPLQEFTINRMRNAGMQVWVVSCDDELIAMTKWFWEKQGGRDAAQKRNVTQSDQREHQRGRKVRPTEEASNSDGAAERRQSTEEAQ